MDNNSNVFDTPLSQRRDDPAPMPWDELLAFVRSAPQLPAVAAARIAQETHYASAGDFGDAQPPLREVRTLSSNSAPTWDGVHRVITILRQTHLLPNSLPTTHSPTVMLTGLLDELALIFTGQRGSRSYLNVAEGAATDSVARFESACIAWLIAGRLRLNTTVTGPLKGYLRHGELMPVISRERVLHAVDAIEGLFDGALAFAEAIRHEEPSLFDFGEPAAV